MTDKILDILWPSIGSATLLSIVAFIGKGWIKKRVSKSIDHLYDVKLESHKADLNKINNEELESIKKDNSAKLEHLKSMLQLEYEMAKTYLVRYSDKQFELYNELWSSLAELKFSVQKLWESATRSNLNILIKKLKRATESFEKSALLIELTHYSELQLILDEISQFQYGKERLIDLRTGRIQINENRHRYIDDYIENNKETKKRLEKYLQQYRECLRKQIKGSYQQPNKANSADVKSRAAD